MKQKQKFIGKGKFLRKTTFKKKIRKKYKNSDLEKQ